MAGGVLILTIEIPDRLAGPLEAHARSKGVSAEGYVCRAVEHAIAEDDTEPEPERQGKRSIWDVVAENMNDVPPGDFAQLPKDGADEHDHYLYGHPKRNQ